MICYHHHPCLKQAIEDVQVFLEYRGYVEQATSVEKVMTKLAGISGDRLYTIENIFVELIISIILF